MTFEDVKMTPPGYIITTPLVQAVPFIFNIPHSGRQYTTSFQNASKLSPLALRSSEDAFLDHLYDFTSALGATTLTARFSPRFC